MIECNECGEERPMRIFIACSKGLYDKVKDYMLSLEAKGHSTYNPLMDTKQINTTEKEILESNLKGIKWADEVHVLWDGSSHGTTFDMGCAYALGKPIKIIYVPEHHWLTYTTKCKGGYLK